MHPLKHALKAINETKLLEASIEDILEKEHKCIEILNELKTYIFNRKVLDHLLMDIGDQHPDLKNSYITEIKLINCCIKNLSKKYTNLSSFNA